jgi:hypothetical protein
MYQQPNFVFRIIQDEGLVVGFSIASHEYRGSEMLVKRVFAATCRRERCVISRRGEVQFWLEGAIIGVVPQTRTERKAFEQFLWRSKPGTPDQLVVRVDPDLMSFGFIVCSESYALRSVFLS